ncbi:MAG TPA: HlyC/CorC family transporter [Gammaproteobacteria bacterium]|nr:HlyC/CorC family transporter [Gammaproteobacteria bacterium]
MSHFQIMLFSLLLTSLVLLAAFFSCAETGLMAVNRYRLRHKARLKKRYAIRLLKLLRRPDRLLGAILIGSTFANVLASSLATLIAFHFWGDKGALLGALALTIVILIFAEITPKTLAALYPDKVAKWVVYPVQFILQLFYPMVWLANAVTNGLLRLLRVRVTGETVEPLSREELRSIVYDSKGNISRQYQRMLLSILDLNKLTVEEVMVPRHQIVGVDVSQPWEKIVEQLQHLHHDWIPFFQETINQVVGVLHVRDILPQLFAAQPITNKEVLQALLQPPYFVPEGTALNVQLGYFQQSADKVAFVVDEYGEVQGLIAMQDILKEIMGDFAASLTVAKRVQQQADGSFLVDGSVTLREFNRLTDWELPLVGQRTINGLIVEYLEALPHPATAVMIAGHPIEILQVKDNQVKLARIFPINNLVI